MKKAWDDLKSFITVITMLLFAYCIIMRIPIPDELQHIVSMVVGIFLGTKINTNTSKTEEVETKNEDITEIER